MTQELIETVDVLRPGKSLVVAIDGPSGSGKSSVSKEVARRLKLAYLDTGAMYRALTWFCLESGTDLDDGAAVETAAETLPLEISTSPQEEYVRVGGHDVTLAIREPAISAAVSAVATTLGARTELIRRQRELIEKHHRRMVVEGRDITTVVAPHAEVRMLLTASEEARLRRRGIQLGGSQNAEQLAAQVTHRDAKDSTVVNFTTAADGVVTLDSSDLDFDETVQAALDIVDTVVNHSPFRSGPSTVTDGRAGLPADSAGLPARPVDDGVEPARGLAPGPRRLPHLGQRTVQRPGGRSRDLRGQPHQLPGRARHVRRLAPAHAHPRQAGDVHRVPRPRTGGVGPAARGPPRRPCGAGHGPEPARRRTVRRDPSRRHAGER